MSRRVWSWSIAATGLQLGLTLLTSVVLARALGPEGRGILAAVTVWAPIIAGIACLSLNDSTLYHLARSQDAAVSGRLAATALLLQLALGVLAAMISLPLVPLLMGSERAPYFGMAVVFSAAFIPMTMISMHQKAVVQGKKLFSKFNLLRLVQPIFYFLALSSLFLLKSVTWQFVVIVQLASLGAALIAGLFFSWPPTIAWNTSEARSLLKTGFHFQGANLILYAAAEMDKVLVIKLMANADVGLYVAAFAIASMGVGLVTQTLAVRLTADISSAADDDRPVLARRYTQAAIVLLALVNLALAAVTPFIVPLLFGAAFKPAVVVGEILLIALFLKGVRSVIDQVMRATHVVRAGMASEATALVVLVSVAPFAVAAQGLMGLAWTVVAAQGAAFLCVSIMAAHRLALPILELWGFSGPAYLDFARLVRQEYGRLAASIMTGR